MTNIIFERFVKTIIEAETNVLHFERFCCDLISAAESIAVVPTSRTWDMGRDGRSLRSGIFLAASSEEHVDDKSDRDIRRIISTTKTLQRLYFCSSRPLSEHGCDKIEAHLRAIGIADKDITILGSTQIAALAAKHSDVAEAAYKSQLQDLRETLQAPDDVDHGNRSLSLALAAHHHPDSDSLRTGVLHSLILDELSRRDATSGELTQNVSLALRLGHKLPSDFFSLTLNELETSGLVQIVNERWQITAEGKNVSQEATPRAASNMVAGRTLIRQELERAIGTALSDDHYGRIWATLKNHLADLFYAKGYEVVSSIASITNAADSGILAPDAEEFRVTLKRMASAIASTSSSPQQAGELETAFLDIFREQTGPAFGWLSSVCVAFVALCSIGLEHDTGKQLQESLRRTHLVLDTDIVLSLLCSAEPNHAGIDEFWRRWLTRGGQLYISNGVAGELAHHAWIADTDFHAAKSWLPGSRTDGIRLIENAFVRDFSALIRSKKAGLSSWGHYISQFRGRSEEDTGPITSLCISEKQIKRLPRAPDASQPLIDKIYAFLYERKIRRPRSDELTTRETKIIADKCRRDAELVGAVHAAREAALAAAKQDAYIIVSSATILRELETEFAADIGDQVLVLGLPAASWLLSLVPGISLGVSALGHLLFEGRFRDRLAPVDRMALRVVKESAAYEMPWARRTTLKKTLDKALRERARTRGERPSDSRERFLTGGSEMREENAKLLAQALEQASVTTATEAKLQAAYEHIAELEAEADGRK